MNPTHLSYASFCQWPEENNSWSFLPWIKCYSPWLLRSDAKNVTVYLLKRIQLISNRVWTISEAIIYDNSLSSRNLILINMSFYEIFPDMNGYQGKYSWILQRYKKPTSICFIIWNFEKNLEFFINLKLRESYFYVRKDRMEIVS